MSYPTTHGGSDGHKDGTSWWNNYSGTKDNHDVQADKMNIKEGDGTHTWYNPRTGEQGMALGDSRQRDW